MPNEAEQVEIPLVDDPDAPVVFVDELTGGGMLQGNFNMTFAVVQYDHSVNPPRMYRKVCLRLVLPEAAARSASQFLSTRLQPGQEVPPTSTGTKLN